MRLTLLVLCILLASCQGLPEQRLYDLLREQILIQQIPGAALAVRTPDGRLYSSADGWAELFPPRAMQPNDRFRIGSITKTFTASTVLLLAEENRLGLDDTIDRYVAELDIPKSNRITIRQLLNHTSGLAGDPYYPDWVFEKLRDDPSHYFPPEAIVKVAINAAPGLLFEPGMSWHYSNFGYTVLGLIVEKVTASTLEQEVGRRLIEPLGLAGTYWPTDENLSNPHAHGYEYLFDERHLIEATYVNPSWEWGGGGMVSTAADLVRWQNSLFRGDLLTSANLKSMLTFVETSGDSSNGYGLGIDQLTNSVVGHGGISISYKSCMAFDLESGLAIAVLLNRYEADCTAIMVAAASAMEYQYNGS